MRTQVIQGLLILSYVVAPIAFMAAVTVLVNLMQKPRLGPHPEREEGQGATELEGYVPPHHGH